MTVLQETPSSAIIILFCRVWLMVLVVPHLALPYGMSDFSLTFAIAVGIIQFWCSFSDEGMEKLQHGNHLPVATGTLSFNNCRVIANLL